MHHTRRHAYNALRRIDLFTLCTDRELNHVLALTTPLHVCAGTILATEGTPVRELLIIVNGYADAAAHGEPPVTLTRNDLIGETSLGHNNPHRATITARTDLELLVSNPRELQQLLATIPTITRQLLLRYPNQPHPHPTTHSHTSTLVHPRPPNPATHDIDHTSPTPHTPTEPPPARTHGP